MSYLYILGTVIFTTIGQLILKWKITEAGPFPANMSGKLLFLFTLLTNFWVISAFVGAFLAALCWMATLSRFDLSYAYPFMSLSFVLVLLLSNMLLQEPINVARVFGVLLIISGITVGSQG